MTTPDTKALVERARELLNSDHARNECPARYAECTCGWSANLELTAGKLADALEALSQPTPDTKALVERARTGLRDFAYGPGAAMVKALADALAPVDTPPPAGPQ